jgi:hypothetical protein
MARCAREVLAHVVHWPGGFRLLWLTLSTGGWCQRMLWPQVLHGRGVPEDVSLWQWPGCVRGAGSLTRLLASGNSDQVGLIPTSVPSDPKMTAGRAALVVLSALTWAFNSDSARLRRVSEECASKRLPARGLRRRASGRLTKEKTRQSAGLSYHYRSPERLRAIITAKERGGQWQEWGGKRPQRKKSNRVAQMTQRR